MKRWNVTLSTFRCRTFILFVGLCSEWAAFLHSYDVGVQKHCKWLPWWFIMDTTRQMTVRITDAPIWIIISVIQQPRVQTKALWVEVLMSVMSLLFCIFREIFPCHFSSESSLIVTSYCKLVLTKISNSRQKQYYYLHIYLSNSEFHSGFCSYVFWPRPLLHLRTLLHFTLNCNSSFTQIFPGFFSKVTV